MIIGLHPVGSSAQKNESKFPFSFALRRQISGISTIPRLDGRISHALHGHASYDVHWIYVLLILVAPFLSFMTRAAPACLAAGGSVAYRISYYIIPLDEHARQSFLCEMPI